MNIISFILIFNNADGMVHSVDYALATGSVLVYGNDNNIKDELVVPSVITDLH